MELWAHWLGNIDQLVLDDDSNVYYLVRPPSPMESAYVESRAPDGAVRWRRDDLGGGSLVWNDGRLYVVDSGWASWAAQQTVRVLALDDASGATVWTRDLADALPPGWDATAVAPEDVFLEGSPAVISSTGDVSVLVAAIENRGVMQWANLGTWLATVDGQSGAVEGSDPLPTLEPRELALTAGGKTLAYGEDGSSGHRLVGFGASGSTWDRGVCAASGILAVSEERALVYAPCGTGPGGLSLIDTQSGTELAPIDEWTVAAVADQDRVFLRSQGSIVVLDSKTGQQLARSPFGVWDTSLHLASSGEIIVYRERSSPNEASALVSVSPSGEIVFACQMDSLQPRVTALGDGVFYVADADYRLKAFALPGVSRALSGWTAPHGDESGRRRPLP